MDAMRQATDTSNEYTRNTLTTLLDLLAIDPKASAAAKRDQLAPFACVWAAMIEAAARDYDSAVKSGVVDNTLQSQQLDALQAQQLHE
jgi:hypothetical protein